MALASALGVSEQAGRRCKTLAAYLESRKALIVLDNCEHLLDVRCARGSIAQRGGIQALATSREGLGAAGEQILGSVARAACGRRACTTPRRSALRRAADWLTGDNAPVVTEICKRLDGIPLAIELAVPACASSNREEIRDRS